jgi:flavin reductase (DIM6/NTAB) family NADH-FMN oxidoreductase RutF
VVNVVNAALAEATNLSSTRLPEGHDEFAFAGVECVPSQTVSPYHVAGAPAALECKLVSISDLNSLDGTPTGTQFVVGQVTGIYLDDHHLNDGLFRRCERRPHRPPGLQQLPEIERGLHDEAPRRFTLGSRQEWQLAGRYGPVDEEISGWGLLYLG